METLRVLDIVGDKCTGYAEGKIVFDVLDRFLSEDKTIEIDMSGITFASSSFYNSAFGELVMKYGIDHLKNRLKVKNLSPKDQFLFSRTISLVKKIKDGVA